MRSDNSYQRFVIIGTARIGSTLLWSYLNSHPEILCLRGVFGSKNKINFGEYYQELPAEYNSIELIKSRNEDSIHFLENYVFKNFEKKYKAVGFKYFYDHDRHIKSRNSIVDYFIANSDIRFIHLKRQNLLATLFSYKRALSQLKWTTANIDFETELSISECEKYFISTREKQAQFDMLFRDRSIQIAYEDFISQPHDFLHDIQKFLGVLKVELRSELKMNNNRPLNEVITNYEELKAKFVGTEYEQFFEKD
jgi:hypothetical protein